MPKLHHALGRTADEHVNQVHRAETLPRAVHAGESLLCDDGAILTRGVTEFTRSAAYIATAIATRGVDIGPTEQAAAAAFQSANGFRTARS